jgi:tetratricopeptide (TPR) repeat protein
MARLSHPNIGGILEAGESSDGQPFFAMELIEGLSITRFCDQKVLTLDQRLELFVDVCRGAEHAHQKLVLHRDLKPSNVLVTEINDRPLPKIIDFGISKWLDESNHGDSMTGDRLIGTPAYMSPEALGLGGEVDTRSDVFSLGVLLYELVAGVLPWSDQGRAPLQLLKDRETREPRRPSTQITTLEPLELEEIASLRRLTPTRLEERLDGDLGLIAMKAIDREPDRRYSSAAGLAADLERLLRNEPVTARAPSAGYLLRKLMVRHRRTVFAGLLVLTMLVLGSIGTVVGLLRARKAEATAQMEAAAAIQARNEAQEIADFLTEIFGASAVTAREAKRPPTEITAVDLLQQGSKRIETDLTDQPIVAARFDNTLGRVYRQLGLFDDAARHLEAARDRLDGVTEGQSRSDRGLLARTLLHLSQVELRRGEYEEARISLNRAGNVGESAFEGLERDSFWAQQLGISGRLYRRAGEFELAEKELQESIRLFQSAPEVDETEVLAGISNLGGVFFNQERWVDAEAEFRSALDLAQRILPAEHPRTAQVLSNLAAAIASQGRKEEARPLFEQALRHQRHMLGDKHPALANALNSLGILESDLRHFDRAEAFHREALGIRREALGDNHPSTAWSLDNLSRTMADQGEIDAAWKMQEEALRIREAALGAGHPQIARSLEHLGDLSLENSDSVRSLDYYQKALAARESTLESGHPSLAETADKLAALLLDIGEMEEARRIIEKFGANVTEEPTNSEN